MSSEDLQIIESRKDLEAAIKVLSDSPNYILYDCFSSNFKPNSEGQKYGYHGS